MAYATDQLRKALRTLPWYIAIPLLPALVIALFAHFLLGSEISTGIWQMLWASAGLGFFVWCMRQCLRLLWTIRQLSR